MADLIPKIEYGSGPTTIEFLLPPEGYDNEGLSIKANASVSTAGNGAQQVSFNHNDERHSLKFKFVTEAIKDQVVTFFKDHASLGFSFTYFFDKDVPATATTMEIDKSGLMLKPKRDTTTNLYSFTLKLRKKI